MRGRKPKPTATKKLEGNPGKRKLNNAEPQYRVKPPTCPHHVTGLARREWRRLVREMRASGVLAVVDRNALAAYCVAFARWADAEEKLAKSGMILKSDGGGLYQNPYLAIANRAIEQLIKIGSEFGFTPSSRTRIKVEPVSGFDQLEMELFGPAVAVSGHE